MTDLPDAIIQVFALFSPLFSRPVYKNTLELIVAHFLCTGKRTVTNLIKCLGKHKDTNFTKYFYVLRKAKWSTFKSSNILFLSIVDRLLPKDAPIEINIDTHLNRRKGPKIKGLGYHRDAVASSKKQKVLTTGHNWLVATVCVNIFGSKYKWSLPFLSYLLTPEKPLSSSCNKADLKGKSRHKKMTKVTCQIILQVRRWLGPKRKIIIVADSAFCCREICKTCIKHSVIFCTQLRLDASLYDFPPIHKGGRGRPRVVGKRLPNLETLANDKKQKWVRLSAPWYNGKTKNLDVLTGTCLWYHNTVGGVPIRWIITKDPCGESKPIAILITDFRICAEQAIAFFVGRWSIETTFQEINRHFNLETIHTWSDTSINRTAPTIIASYSLACLVVNESIKNGGAEITPQATSWYEKKTVTFSDVMIYLKLLILNKKYFPQLGNELDCGKIDIEELFHLVACA
ncbi:MAG: transposase [Oscillospiraceae bacterium]